MADPSRCAKRRPLSALLACLLLLGGLPPLAGKQIELEFKIWSQDPLQLELLNEIGSAYSGEHPGAERSCSLGSKQGCQRGV